MSKMNSFVNDFFERIAEEAGKLAKHDKKATISSREIRTAVRLVLPGELGKYAISEGTKGLMFMFGARLPKSTQQKWDNKGQTMFIE